MWPHFFFLQLVARGGRRACGEGLVRTTNFPFPGSTYIALSADHLVTVEFGGESLERWLDDTTTEPENKVESRFLLIAQSATK